MSHGVQDTYITLRGEQVYIQRGIGVDFRHQNGAPATGYVRQVHIKPRDSRDRDTKNATPETPYFLIEYVQKGKGNKKSTQKTTIVAWDHIDKVEQVEEAHL